MIAGWEREERRRLTPCEPPVRAHMLGTLYALDRRV